MKKLLCVVITTLLVAFLMVSCVPRGASLPEGVWKNEDLDIVLFLERDYRDLQFINFFLGKQSEDGCEIKIIVIFDNRPGMTLFKDIAVREGGILEHSYSNAIWGGTFRIRGDALYFRTTDSTITFHRLHPGEYEPPNPDDWFAHLREETEVVEDEADRTYNDEYPKKEPEDGGEEVHQYLIFCF